MKELLLIFHLIIVMGLNLNAQLSDEVLTSPQIKQFQKNSNKLYFLVAESFPLKEKGRIFLTNDFIKSTIIDFEKEEFEVELRYRFADDEMQIMHQEKIKAIVPQKIKKLIFKVDGKEQVFVPMEYSNKKNINLGYFELLVDGEMKLLKQFQRKGKEKIRTVLFFQNKNEPAKTFKVKNSSILKFMSKHKNSVSRFIVKNKIDVKKENDLKKVFEYYNSLL
ncbi:MAG: hypothetical protein AB8F94_12935 [Saprospiraceae bacterium]